MGLPWTHEYSSIALSSRNHYTPIGSTPSKALANMIWDLKKSGVVLRERKKAKLSWNPRLNVIALQERWFTRRDTLGKLAHLVHEATHNNRRKNCGSAKFSVRYVFDARYRCAVEIEARRAELAVLSMFGFVDVEKFIVAHTKMMADPKGPYKLGRLEGAYNIIFDLLSEPLT